jgi:hypothetical protein
MSDIMSCTGCAEFLGWWATDDQGIVDGLSMHGLKLAATQQSQEGPRCHMPHAT